MHPLSLDPLTLDVTPSEMVDHAAEAGFDYVGFWIHSPYEGFPRPILHKGTEEFEKVRQKLAQHGLKTGNLEVFNLTPSFKVDAATIEALETGNLLGAPGVSVAFLGDIPEDLIVKTFGELSRAAADYGLRTNIEFMALSPSMASLEKALRVIEVSKAANGGVTLDALHLMRTKTSIESVAALDAALIGHVQICDGPADMPPDKYYWEAGDFRLYPGEGEFPLAEIFDAMPSDIVVGVEVPRAPDVDKGAGFGEIAKRCHDTARTTLECVRGRR